MVKNIRRLTVRIDKLIDGPYAESNTYSLRFVHLKLGYFYNKEEIYWAQRSRIRWLKEGNRNTRFFHVSATRRSKKNRIDRIVDDNGNWVTDIHDVSKVVGDYFSKLFKSTASPNDMNAKLANHFTDEEILNVINHIPRKASRIDGLSNIFFKENWEVVGKDVLKLCHEILTATRISLVLMK
ncbi:hypothetical protein V6Z11_D06G138700 [Gossypium hirsutum]